MKKKQFVVIGLGSFGGSICRELMRLGMEVLAIDKDEDVVSDFVDCVTHAVIGDSADENVLKSIGIWNFDHVIVAIGNDIQASILTTLILKELGVEMVTAKAINDYHAKVLEKIGADEVVHPERDMGRRLAHNIISANILDYLQLSEIHSLVEIASSSRISGKSIIDLNIRARYGINIVAIKRKDELIVSPQATEVLQMDDILIVIGANEDINRFEKNVIAE